MAGQIRHQGIVDSVREGVVTVRILQASACAGCQVSNLCHVSESKEKLVDVFEDDAQSKFAVGQQVMLAGSESQGMKAVMLAFGIPVLLLIAAIAGIELCGLREAVAALVALGILVPYFFVLYLCRDRLKGSFSFEIIEQ